MVTSKSKTVDYGSPAVTKNYYEHTRRKTVKDYLDEFAEKHSEFWKPYASKSFHDMDNWYPDPNPEPWNWDPTGKGPTGGRGDSRDPTYSVPRSGGEEDCVLKCGTTITDCTKIHTCNAPGLDIYRIDVVKGFRYVDNIDTESSTGTFPKDIIKVKFATDSPIGTKVRLAVFTRILGGQHIMPVGGHICYIDYILNCCGVAEGETLEYDESTSADTIGQNDSVVVAVVGNGGAPYTWSVGGTGYSIPRTTQNATNTLSSDGTACGAATVVVTDCAGNETFGSLRNSASGTWYRFQRDTYVLGCGTQCATPLTYYGGLRHNVNCCHSPTNQNKEICQTVQGNDTGAGKCPVGLQGQQICFDCDGTCGLPDCGCARVDGECQRCP